MGFLDKLKDMMSGRESKARKAMDEAGDRIDDRTGHRYSSRIDTTTDKAEDRLGLADEPRERRDDGR